MNDYEEDNAEYGVESVGWIAAHLKAKDMGWGHHINIQLQENLSHCCVNALSLILKSLTFNMGLSLYDALYFIDKNTKQTRKNVTETLLLNGGRRWTP